MKLVAVALASCLFSATVHADTGSGPSKADMEKFMAFFDKLVDIVVADKADCSKMSADITKHIDANAELLKKGEEARAKGQKPPKDVQDHLVAGGRKMAAALQEKCMQDKGVQGAISRLGMRKP